MTQISPTPVSHSLSSGPDGRYLSLTSVACCAWSCKLIELIVAESHVGGSHAVGPRRLPNMFDRTDAGAKHGSRPGNPDLAPVGRSYGCAGSCSTHLRAGSGAARAGAEIPHLPKFVPQH